MLDIGRIAVMRIVEDECRRDPKYLARIHRNGRVILSDVREMDDAELVKRLRALGLECDRDAIASLAPGMRSAGDLEDELARRAGVTLPDLDDDFAWLALIVLWERWLPDVPNAEMLDESMQRGYQFYEARDGLMAVVEEWARTWEMVKDLSRRFGALSVEVFDRMFPITQCVFN